MTSVRVAVMCPGLGHIGRGYESFTRELFDELRSKEIFDLSLFKGAGKREAGEYVLPCLKRNSRAARLLAQQLDGGGYDVEQFTFFLSSIPVLLRLRPHVIVFSDFKLGTYLWHLRRLLNLRYRLLFSNGAPNGPPFTRCDHVQQLLPCHLERALRGGTPREMQSLIPYAIRIDKRSLERPVNRQEAKIALSLPPTKKVVLSVGALNDSHKRMRYLIDEFSARKDGDLFLVMLGQPTPETPEVTSYARAKLREDEYRIESVRQEQVVGYYHAADMFVLCSLAEGLPRVAIEAMSQGLPIVVHDYEVTRETLRDNAIYVDMTRPGALSARLGEIARKPFDHEEQRRSCYEQYSWDALLPRYIEMIEQVASR
jgi:1,2-diacylglycerol 3-alpha-glucosyltransferase